MGGCSLRSAREDRLILIPKANLISNQSQSGDKCRYPYVGQDVWLCCNSSRESACHTTQLERRLTSVEDLFLLQKSRRAREGEGSDATERKSHDDESIETFPMNQVKERGRESQRTQRQEQRRECVQGRRTQCLQGSSERREGKCSEIQVQQVYRSSFFEETCLGKKADDGVMSGESLADDDATQAKQNNREETFASRCLWRRRRETSKRRGGK